MTAAHSNGELLKQSLSVFEPIRILEVELSQPLPTLEAIAEPDGRRYRYAHVLVRLHTHPLGTIELSLPEDGLPPDEYIPTIWQSFGLAINAHLSEDGLPVTSKLTAAGLSNNGVPFCLQQRQHFLALAPFVSIIVCTRDRTDELARCLTSLLQLEYPRYEIIVVDNAPKTSATADLIQTRYAHKPHLRYVREERPGLSWARNCGLQYAQGEIVAYTDDDVVVDRFWLAELIKAFQATENVACVTGPALPAELETQAQVWFEQFGGLSKVRGATRLYFNLTTYRPPDPLYPYVATKYGAGVNMAFKTAILRSLGGFNPALGTGTPTCGGEELEVYFQIITKGYTLVFEPNATLRHFHRRDEARLRKQLHGCGIAFTAYLTCCLVDDPRRLIDLLKRSPYALHYLFSPRSVRNERKRADFPADLTRRELWGMFIGPFAYFHSKWRLRSIIKRIGSPMLKA